MSAHPDDRSGNLPTSPSANALSATPRTDREVFLSDGNYIETLPAKTEVVEATFARQLERELADLRHDMARGMANHNADLSVASHVASSGEPVAWMRDMGGGPSFRTDEPKPIEGGSGWRPLYAAPTELFKGAMHGATLNEDGTVTPARPANPSTQRTSDNTNGRRSTDEGAHVTTCRRRAPEGEHANLLQASNPAAAHPSVSPTAHDELLAIHEAVMFPEGAVYNEADTYTLKRVKEFIKLALGKEPSP